MTDYSLFIPCNPVAKGRPKMGKWGVYTPKKTMKAEADLRLALAKIAPKERIIGPISLHLTFVMPIPASWSKKQRTSAIGRPHCGRPDLDNLVKTVLDALNPIRKKGLPPVGGMIGDDSQICWMTASKRYGHEPGIDFILRTL